MPAAGLVPDAASAPEGRFTGAAMERPEWAGAPVPAASAAISLGRVRHGDSLLRRAGRGMRHVVGVSTSRYVRDRTGLAADLQRPVTTTRRIAVTSVRGGAGKTTIAALVASALALHRHDRVLLLDADPAPGSIGTRFGLGAGVSPEGLAGRQPGSFDEVSPFLRRTRAGLWILSGTTAGRPFDPAAAAAVSRFFAVVVIDCGAGLVGEVQWEVLATAQACIHVAPTTADGVRSAHHAVDWLGHNHQGIVPRTVHVFASRTPHARADLGRVTARLQRGGVGVAHLPYDRHLASGGVLTPDRLAESSRQGAMRIAAEALTRAGGRR